MNASRTWADRYVALQATLTGLGRDASKTPLQRRHHAIFAAWRTMRSAPGPILKLYEETPESDLAALATQMAPGGTTFRLAPDPDDDRQRFLNLAAFLRALDLERRDDDIGAFSSELPYWWEVALDGEKAFVLPVTGGVWRVPPAAAKDYRPFAERGLVRHRVIPAEIDGAAVILKPGNVPPGAWPGTRKFVAGLFEGFRLETSSVDDGKRFLATKVTCSNRDATLQGVLEATCAKGCMAAVFPELSIDDTALDMIQTMLATRPWEDSDPASSTQRTPALVVAGSWHREKDGKMANIAPLLDGNGAPIFEHHKRLTYRAKSNHGFVPEAIVAGDKLHVLVLDDCLVAIGICLDYADFRYEKVYDELDVDLVLVPSCGDRGTIISHLMNAIILETRRGIRTLVVQQAYPPDRYKGVLGFVLPPVAIAAKSLIKPKTDADDESAPAPVVEINDARWSVHES